MQIRGNWSVFMVLFAAGFLLSCEKNTSLFLEKSKKKEVQRLVERQKLLAVNRFDKLFNVYDQDLSVAEKEGLDFLFAYMPLSDLSNLEGDYFLNHARMALKTRETFPWGNKVSNDLFLHYVLPFRVNNEYTDTARMVFFRELNPRLEGMNMRQAALEVNHWCHEKVTYQSTDEYRTSSPLNTVKTAFGRCGEQSTFTVAAMRAVGIPARQIYTPRWAHVNDNHAWVEVWVDGDWHFMGACEPEPDLNMGWFESPAKRAMLLHHRTYGHIDTEEEMVKQNRYYSEVNVLEDYSPAKRLTVKVLGDDDLPVEGADVYFQLANFAEFYNIASLKTDDKGICSFLTGRGDLMVLTAANDKVSWQKVSVADTDTLLFDLEKHNQTGSIETIVMNAPPPVDAAKSVEVEREEHIQRLHEEDSIRGAYENTFIDSVDVVRFANDYGLETIKTLEIFEQSRGNWPVIKEFLQYAAPKNPEMALEILLIVSPKDRRDTPLPVFKDHFDFSLDTFSLDKRLYVEYVLNPRVRNELISSYKKIFQDFFGDSFIMAAERDINVLLDWIVENIEIKNNANAWKVPQLPVGVLELRVADTNSLNIFFVALARSFGIPARVETASKQPQVLVDNQWMDVNPQTGSIGNKPKGKITLDYTKSMQSEILPSYYKDFTISRFNGKGFNTLDYSRSDVFDQFPATLVLEEGLYALMTVARLSNGSQKVRRQFWEINREEHTTVSVVLPGSANERDIVEDVSLNLDKEMKRLTNGELVNLESLSRNGLVLIWLDPAREPSKHLMNDLIRLRGKYDQWEGHLAILLKPEKITSAFSPSRYNNLPERSLFLADSSDWLENIEAKTELNLNNNMPVVFVFNPAGEVVFQSRGYRIGVGDEVLSNVMRSCKLP